MTTTLRGVLTTLMVLLASVLPLRLMSQGESPPTEAPAGFDGKTNGMIEQGSPLGEGEEPVPLRSFEDDKAIFEEKEGISEGVGPTYNALSCAECHQSPVTGAISQVTELRAGHLNASKEFVDAPGGSLIHSRAIDARIQEQLSISEPIRSFRTSLNTLGDGFVECIADETLEKIASDQPQAQRGTIIRVPVLESNNAMRVGRFGWKNQHASLLSFAADAYLNEMGITSPMFPTENTSMGNPVGDYDQVDDPENDGEDVKAFAEFMRATKAPPRDDVRAATAGAVAGSALFDQVRCSTCHVRNIVTAPAGTVINGGAFTVPEALGNKVIHPFSDFLLHDIGTGDGIVQNGGQSSRSFLRTPPLWGVRTRNRLMHDGESLTLKEAIMRHGGQAATSRASFNALSLANEDRLIEFLLSL